VTLRNRRKVATALSKIVKGEFTKAVWSRIGLRHGLRALAAQAQRMGLAPEDVLTVAGRDAFVVIARAIAQERPSNPSLCAEWALVVRLAEPEFSIQEQELFAS
jgi:hypothetical protein